MDKGARDCRPLLFAAAQLMNEVRRAVGEPDEREQFPRPRRCLLRCDPLEQQRQADILECVHRWQEIEKLKDEAEPAPAELRQGSVIRTRQIQPIDDNLARGRPIEAGDEMEKGAFAAAARTDDRDELMPRDCEGDILERMDGALARFVGAANIA